MRLYDINGRLKKKAVSQYLIDWDGKSRSKIQFNTKQFLKPYWRNSIIYEEFHVYGSLMKVDILNVSRKIAVEVNGKQHDKFNKFFHANSRVKFLESIKRDMVKREWLEKNGFLVIEIEEDEVKDLSEEFFIKKFNLTL